MTRVRLLLSTLLTFTLVACKPTPPVRSCDRVTGTVRVDPWLTKLDRNHPLVSTLWSEGKPAHEALLLERAMHSAIVYLGEKHDNADHHRLQADVLGKLVARGAHPALVLEMVDEDRQSDLDALAMRRDRGEALTANDYRDALHWEQSGWPDFALYAPLFDVALAAKLRIVAGNAPKALVKRVAMHADPDPNDEPTRNLLGLDEALAPAAQAQLESELEQSHCGMLPKTALPAMARAQRLRDTTLARHARQQEHVLDGPWSVVVCGNGHARRDFGAPFGKHNAALRQLSIAFTEVDAGDGATAPADAPYDFVWYTPRANDEDHCAKFRAAK